MNSEINYDDRVCLFLDILGFKEHVKSTVKKDELNIEKITEIANLLSVLPLKVKRFGAENHDRQITQFSDSIVVSFRLTDKNAFAELLDDLMIIVINFLNKGYLVRGGISYGKLYHKQNIVFGPAMNTAYELESKVAVYPRIIFDKELVEELINNGDTSLKKIMINSNIKTENIWKEDFDGKFYLNYLAGAKYYIEEEADYTYYLNNLRELISKAWRNRTVPAVRAKYGWLRSKFNLMVDNMVENSEEIVLLKRIK